MEGRDRPIDRLAKNVLLFGQQDEGEVDVSVGRRFIDDAFWIDGGDYAPCFSVGSGWSGCLLDRFMCKFMLRIVLPNCSFVSVATTVFIVMDRVLAMAMRLC